MVPQVPLQPVEEGRVKVYELSGEDWLDRGTGLIDIRRCNIEHGFDSHRIIVKSEGNLNHLLLDTDIQTRKKFQQQKGNIIVWEEYESGTHMALSFPDSARRAYIWVFVQTVLDSSLEAMTQNLLESRAEVFGEVQEDSPSVIPPAMSGLHIPTLTDIGSDSPGPQLPTLLPPTATSITAPHHYMYSTPSEQMQQLHQDQNQAQAQLQEQIQAQTQAQEAQAHAQAQRQEGKTQQEQLAELHIQMVDQERVIYNRLMSSAAFKFGGAENIPQETVDKFKESSYHQASQMVRELHRRRARQQQQLLEHQQQQQQAAQNAQQVQMSAQTEAAKADFMNNPNISPERVPYLATEQISHLATDRKMEVFAAATDSGYASLPTHDNKPPIQNSNMNEHQQFQSEGSDTNYKNTSGNEDRFVDDTSSVYTAGPNIPPSKKDAYISLLADDLLNKAFKEKPDEESLERVRKALPRYLKTFAMKVGSSDPAPISRDMMVFVHKHRSEISNTMIQIYITENRVRSDGLQFDTISNWYPDTDNLEDPNAALNERPDDALDDSQFDDLDEADRATDSLPELSDYRDFVSQHSAYEWLLQCIQKELYMDEPGNTQASIRKAILECLPTAQRVSRSKAPQTYSLTFTADWDLGSFLRDQEYIECPERAIDRAVTITGSKRDAQAATTIQYLSQTWPSSGIYLLHVVKHAVQDTNSIPFSYYLPDRTQLIARSREPKFELEVIGTAESIADIGEQLAWLGSALRSSPSGTGVTIVGASVSGIGMSPTNEMSEGQKPTFFCSIGFNVVVINNTDETSNGECWHQLFQNAVIVKGFPIPRRPTSHMGLEISLDILARLAGTRYISTFDNQIFIKGFSIMLVPTRYSDNILLWHLLCKKNGDRISYLEGKDIHGGNVSLPDLEKSRHILGWSSQIRYLVGSADANYNINRSWSRGLHDNCMLKGKSIKKDELIQSNHEAAIGKRETPPWIIHKPYREKLLVLSQKYMVLWDVGCKRGWLVNGVNALLHLFRASVKIKRNKFLFDSLFRSERFEEASSPYTISAAVEVLMNPANLDMELYEQYERDKSGAKIKFRVCDRLNDLFDALEKAIDYQQMITGSRGEGLKAAPRKDLEGWDFKDIAANENSIDPRLTKLKTVGKGWVDFTRAVGAVFLFGNDFGNLIEPAEENSTCSHWETLPANKYYLAASVEDLHEIMDRMGNPIANPPQLTNSLVCNPFNMALNMRCNCNIITEMHCERAQAIWPLCKSQQSPESTSLSKEVDGAVVFGHNASIGWIWNDFGDPEKGELPSMDEESDDDNFADSGFGPSLRSSTIPEPQHIGQNTRSLRHEHYKVAIICALPKELKAVRALFDEKHQKLPQDASDTNKYALGSLGTYNVVAACLPSGRNGNNAAAKVASDIQKSFRNLKWYLVVGIGGGIPSSEHDIRLGDVVVGNGIIQHDLGKMTEEDSQIRRIGVLVRPAKSLQTTLSWLESDPYLAHDALEAHIQRIIDVRPEYQSLGEHHDTLFYATSGHERDQKTCENCKGPSVPRKTRPSGPHIHYGIIASGNQVIKNAALRDRIGAETGALCVEMEAAGVMEIKKCLVIRGICDYADSHKNDNWHKYAAATAAAYAKFFLLQMPDLDIENREEVPKQKRPVSSVEEETREINMVKRLRFHQE